MPTSWSTNGRLVSWTPLGVQPKQVFPHPLPSALDLLPHLSLPLEPHHPAQGHIDYIMSLCMFNDGSDSIPQLVSPAFSPRWIITAHYCRWGGGRTRAPPPVAHNAMQNWAPMPPYVPISDLPFIDLPVSAWPPAAARLHPRRTVGHLYSKGIFLTSSFLFMCRTCHLLWGSGQRFFTG